MCQESGSKVNAETSKEEDATQKGNLAHNHLKACGCLQERNPCDVLDKRREDITVTQSVLEQRVTNIAGAWKNDSAG